MDRESLATRTALGGGAFTTGLVFVAGCLGSKVLIVLGVSSGALSAFSALEPYRPLLLAVGLAAIAFGSWRLYRSRASRPVAARQAKGGPMTEADGRAARDLTGDRWASFLLWKLPPAVLVASGLLPIDPVARGILWALSLGVLGGGCVTNALRCGRLHCYLTGPFFLLMAATSLLHGLRVLPLGAYGWAWLGGVTLLGAIVLTYVPERVWGKYARSS